ncbi:MAG: cytochrome c peroxidase [Pseudomonadota bacterium]|nr:cytochrome c peroxidase [Pseudomonadota bacterium]
MKQSWLIILASAVFPSLCQAYDNDDRPVFSTHDYEAVELGWLLFYDPILSGNRNISCGTCHHPKFGTADGVALSLGEGGIGLGPERIADPKNMPEQRIPRNAPALFNLGAEEFQVMFHDGRLEADPTQPGGMRTPLGQDMVAGFDSVLSAQAMFPVLSPDEMAGHYSENEIAQAVRLGRLSGEGGAWDLISQRVSDIPEYEQRFATLLGPGEPVEFTDIANVLAAFIAEEWRADESPYDLALTGEKPLSDAAQRGQDIFTGKAQCSSCHSGRFQTDHSFHGIGIPQFGPGKAARFESHNRDEGRGRVTGQLADFYTFRTPSLRNVTLTGPYGHNGAFTDLREMVAFHTQAVSEHEFDQEQVVLPVFDAPNDWDAFTDQQAVADIKAASSAPVISLSEGEMDDLMAFLHALTDVNWRTRGLGVPEAVPSGLPVDR